MTESESPQPRSNQNRNRSNQNRNRSNQNRNRSNQNRNRSNQNRDSASSRERTVTAPVIVLSQDTSQHDRDQQRLRNGRWIWKGSALIGFVLGLIVALLTFWINLAGGIILGILVGIIVMFFVKSVAPTTVHNNIGAALLEENSLPRVDVLLGGLSATMGVATPSIGVLDDPIPNACVYARKQGNVIVITSGLLQTMSLVELEAVFAHLLAHIRLGSVNRGTAGAGLSLLLGSFGRRGALSHRWIGQGSLYEADELAALTIRYPVSVASALAKMEQGPLPEADSFFASTPFRTIRWLFIDPSIVRRARADEVGDLDATSTRRQALEEM